MKEEVNSRGDYNYRSLFTSLFYLFFFGLSMYLFFFSFVLAFRIPFYVLKSSSNEEKYIQLVTGETSFSTQCQMCNC